MDWFSTTMIAVGIVIAIIVVSYVLSEEFRVF